MRNGCAGLEVFAACRLSSSGSNSCAFMAKAVLTTRTELRDSHDATWRRISTTSGTSSSNSLLPEFHCRRPESNPTIQRWARTCKRRSTVWRPPISAIEFDRKSCVHGCHCWESANSRSISGGRSTHRAENQRGKLVRGKCPLKQTSFAIVQTPKQRGHRERLLQETRQPDSLKIMHYLMF